MLLSLFYSKSNRSACSESMTREKRKGKSIHISLKHMKWSLFTGKADMIIFIQSPSNPINNETEGNLVRLLNMGLKSHKDISIQLQLRNNLKNPESLFNIQKSGLFYLKGDMNPL